MLEEFGGQMEADVHEGLMPKTDGRSLNCWRQTVRKRGSILQKWYKWPEEK